MSKSLLKQLVADCERESNPRALTLIKYCQARHGSESFACTVASIVFIFATFAVGLIVITLLADDFARDMPLLSSLKRIDPDLLQVIAVVCIALSSAVFMMRMKLRAELTKCTFAIIMITNGDLKEAAALMTGEKGASGILTETAGAVLDSI